MGNTPESFIFRDPCSSICLRSSSQFSSSRTSHLQMHVQIRVQMHVQIRVQIRVQICVQIRVHIHVQIHDVYTYRYTYRYTNSVYCKLEFLCERISFAKVRNGKKIRSQTNSMEIIVVMNFPKFFSAQNNSSLQYIN